VPQLEHRLLEVTRLGFTRAVVPKGARDVLRAPGLEVVPVSSVGHAVEQALIPAR
jgi:predicted ATP-dependent serine protease